MSDRRRITGPESALPLVFAPTPNNQSTTKSPQEKTNSGIRNFFIKTGIVSNCNGSCFLEVDNTTIIVSVYGAKPIRGSSVTSASFSVMTKVSNNLEELSNFTSSDLSHSKEEKEEQKLAKEDEYVTTNQIGKTQLSLVEQKLSTYIQTAFLPSILLEKYPKSSIEVFINILTNDSHTNSSLLSLITWCANCTSLALVDSGIELKDMVSTGIAKLTDDQTVVIDPSYSNEGRKTVGGQEVRAVASYMSVTDTVVGLMIESEEGVNGEMIEKVIDGCNTMAREIRSNMNGFLVSTM
ncbi:exosome non-catalytic core subunit [Saccharomycopsis crataegensis]|uniref:Exosome non-catalytic core subunit n=1 Tax=Saccharomycopsis crataegensis TaxID=43959 RepID=A0AAV5QS68_9ASCO|nr:exosome non-catalytic core subunit [Saccharomycopsis crataegensis]